MKTDGELPGLSLPNERGRKPGEDIPLPHGKNSDATTLLQEGSLLILAAVLGSLNTPEVASCSHYTSIQSYDVINRLF